MVNNMSSVKSIALQSERPWSNGLFKRRYEIELTDTVGANHVFITMPIKQLDYEDGAKIAADYLAAKISGEASEYKSQVAAGINPFLNDSLWNSRMDLLKPILDDALTLPSSDPLVQNGLPFFSLVTDEEIMALYSKDQAFVDSARIKASTLIEQLAALNNYEPEVL
jgi:hypothetical protein